MYKGKEIKKHNLKQMQKAQKYLKEKGIFNTINVKAALQAHHEKQKREYSRESSQDRSNSRTTGNVNTNTSIANSNARQNTFSRSDRELPQSSPPNNQAKITNNNSSSNLSLLWEVAGIIEEESEESMDIDMSDFLRLTQKAQMKRDMGINGAKIEEPQLEDDCIPVSRPTQQTLKEKAKDAYDSFLSTIEKGQYQVGTSQSEINKKPSIPEINGLKIIDRNQTNSLRTINDVLKNADPVTKNYRIGSRQQWQKTTKIPDHSLTMVLRRFPRIKDFKNNQKAIIKCSLLKNDVFVCMPTGGGKSLTFQLMTFVEKGIYLCILPLVSLIFDQEMQARGFGIKAFSLTGAKELKENKEIYNEMLNYERGEESIVIFCTPEKVSKSPQFFSVLNKIYSNDFLVKIIIDEVHCVFTWGKQFRQDYQNLSILRQNFPKTPILGLTATVTEAMKQDIIKRLNIQNCFYFQSSFNRSNLHYEVRVKTKDCHKDIIEILQKKEFKDKSGIIYCLARKSCEQMCQFLKQRRYRVAFYHAQVNNREKEAIQQKWMRNQIQIIIATIAFGMGINKPDVRFVIHHSLSKSLENYYQESGRAGRDGMQAKCILFYRRSDKISLQNMILKNQISDTQNKNFNLKQLSNIIRYCEEKYTCRRKLQLEYLGELDFNVEECMRTCDNCINSRKYVEVECIEHAKFMVNFLLDLLRKNQVISQCQIIQYCKGSKNKQLRNKLEALQRLNIDLDGLERVFQKWRKEEIDQLLIELCNYEIFFEKITLFNPSGRGKNKSFTNIYLSANYNKAQKFLREVESLPMKRKINSNKERSQLNANKSDEMTQSDNDFQDEGDTIDKGSDSDDFEEEKYSFSNFREE